MRNYSVKSAPKKANDEQNCCQIKAELAGATGRPNLLKAGKTQKPFCQRFVAFLSFGAHKEQIWPVEGF